MDPKSTARTAIDGHAEELRQINRWMYDNPEVAFQEHGSSAKLAAFLTDQGFEVEYPAYGLETSPTDRLRAKAE